MNGIDLLALIGRDTLLKRTCARHGGEYSGPCPLCRCGTDRFKVWPQLGRWACLGPNAGRSGCDRGGDAIQYLRQRDGLSYRAACARLGIDPTSSPSHLVTSSPRHPLTPSPSHLVTPSPRHPVTSSPSHLVTPSPAHPLTPSSSSPPNPMWQAHGNGWAARCAGMLWSTIGESARTYLHKRGLKDDVLRAFNVGYNPVDVYEQHAQWGLLRPDNAKRIWLPRGITFPWYVDGGLWRLNVRRPLTPAQIAAGEPKYIGPAGFANALYNAGALSETDNRQNHRPAVLVEGEIDALTVVQACGSEVAVVATGSTAGARAGQWVAKLALAPVVLIAFDVDANGAGDKAAAWWLNALPQARRWRPLLHDVNSRPAVEDVRAWIIRGVNVGA